MLYNKDWNKSKIAPTADLLSLDGLIAWLETKDPTQRYSFNDADHCMLAQWVRHLDSRASNVPSMNTSYIYQVNGQIVNFKHTIFSMVATTDGSTFGDALKTAKKYQGRM